MICLSCADATLKSIDELQKQGYPIILRGVDRPIEDLPCDCVGIDIADAYEVLMLHMHEQGARSIGLVGGLAIDQMSRGVFKHWAARYVVSACENLGMSVDPRRFIACEQSADSAFEAVVQALADKEIQFDAILVQSAKLLLGVYGALNKLGRTIPDDCMLACISDSDICRYAGVPVTGWDQPVEKICRGLVKLLLERMQGEKRVRHVQYASRLIVRESTRCQA